MVVGFGWIYFGMFGLSRLDVGGTNRVAILMEIAFLMRSYKKSDRLLNLPRLAVNRVEGGCDVLG